MHNLDFVEREILRGDLPPFRVGDAVRVHVRVTEGDKERIQIFEGLVIRRRGGGMNETFTVRKIASGVGVERIFPVQSPLVTKVDIKSRGYVRRSRLYYLRDLSGKKARLHSKVRDLSGLLSDDDMGAGGGIDEVEAEVAVEESSETAPVAEADDQPKGKARKRLKAKDKALRMKNLKAEEAELAKKKEAEEAEAAKKKEAEEAETAKAQEAEAAAAAAEAEEAATEDAQGEETPAEEAPAEETPADDAAVEEDSADGPAVEEAPADETPVESEGTEGKSES